VFDPTRPAPGYRLLWPRDLFRTELAAVVEVVPHSEQYDSLKLLFTEAFYGPDPLEDLDTIRANMPADVWDPAPGQEALNLYARQRAKGAYVRHAREILAHIYRLAPHTPRSYYLQRQNPSSGSRGQDDTDWLALQRAWVEVVNDLINFGYLDRRAGDRCRDGQRPSGQDQAIDGLIAKSCGDDAAGLQGSE